MFMGLFVVGNAQTSITVKERKDALLFYREAASDLKKEITGLNEAQLNWKPDDSTWSVSECVEHIALSEKSIFDWAASTLQSPAEADKKSDKTDNAVKSMVESREKKVKTFDALQPKKQFVIHSKHWPFLRNAARTIWISSKRPMKTCVIILHKHLLACWTLTNYYYS